MNELEFENTYRIDGPGRTTGWDDTVNDVNGLNVDGLRPIEVAAKALDYTEFHDIARHASFNPLLGDPRKHAEQTLASDLPDAQERFARLSDFLEQVEQTVSAIRGTDPEAGRMTPIDTQLDNGRPELASAANPTIAPVDASRLAANDAAVKDAANDADRNNGAQFAEPDMERVRRAREADRAGVEAMLSQAAVAKRSAMQAMLASIMERVVASLTPEQAAAEEAEREAKRSADHVAGKSKANEMAASPFFENKGYALPASIVAQYVAFDGKYLDRKTEVVHFEDRGRQLTTDSEDKAVIRNMIEVAMAKNWGELKLKGSEDFKRQAWIAAELNGLKTKGFNPKAQDHALLQVAREEMRISAGEKSAAPERAHTIEVVAPEKGAPVAAQNQGAPADASPAGPAAQAEVKAQAPAPARPGVTEGILVEHGAAPFNHDPKSNPSYYAQVKTPDGERTVWGLDLERAIAESGIVRGDPIELERGTAKPVSVPQRQFDKDGKEIEPVLVDSVRNQWRVSSPNAPERDTATVARAAGTPASAPAAATSAPVAVPLASQAADATPDQIRDAREAFFSRGEAIKNSIKTTPGADHVRVEAAFKVLDSRIAGLPPEKQQRFRDDLQKAIDFRRSQGMEIVVPVPKAAQVLIKAKAPAQSNAPEHGRSDDQTPKQEQAQDIDL